MPDELSSAELLQLRDFLVNRLTENDLRQNLRRLEIQAENLWDSAGNKVDRFFSLLELANRRNWCRLLAFCVLSEFHDAGLAESLLSGYERAGLQLFRVLEDEGVRDEHTVHWYYETKPPDWDFSPPEKASAGTMFVAYSIAKAQEHARQSEPLRNFAQAAAAYFDKHGNQAGRQALDAWWGRAAQELRLGHADLVGRAVHDTERYSVIVEIRETGSSTPQKPCWLRRAWLFSHTAQRFDSLDADSLGTTETPETISSYLSELRERLARRRIPASGVTFEFFVSRTSLSFAIDQWAIQVDDEIKSEIGHESAVVVRDLDRKLPTRDKVRQRWRQLLQSDCLTVSAGSPAGALDSALEAGPGGVLDELYKRFDRSPQLLCLLVTEPFVQRDDFQRMLSLKAAIAAGVPLIIWARCAPAAAALTAEARQWLSEPPRTLPQRIHELRRTRPDGDLDHLGRHVTLFFENAEYWVPADDLLTEAR